MQKKVKKAWICVLGVVLLLVGVMYVSPAVWGRTISEEVSFEEKYTQEHPLHLIYGTKEVVKKFVLKDPEGAALDGEEIEQLAVMPPEDGSLPLVDVEMGERGMIFYPTEVSEGAVPVRVRVETQEQCFETEFYVEVDPCPLRMRGEARAGTKIYDATGKVNVCADLIAEGSLTEAAQKEVEDNFREVWFYGYDSGIRDVRGEEEQTFDFAPEDFSCCPEIPEIIRKRYTIKEGEYCTGTVMIRRRALYLILSGTKRPYRSLEYETDLKDLVGVEERNEDNSGFVGKDTAENLKDFQYPDVLDKTAQGLTAESIRQKDQAACGWYPDGLVLDKDSGNATENYVFAMEKEIVAPLEITPERVRDAGEYVTIQNMTSFHAYETEAKERYVGKKAVVRFALGGGYNRVFLEDGTDITETGLTDLVLPGDGDVVSRQIYLANEKTRTCPFAISFICDITAPSVGVHYTQEENEILRKEQYANSDVTFQVTVREHLLSEIQVEVNETWYTLEELEAEKDSLGIREIQKHPVGDSAGNKDRTEYTFTMVFGDDGSYRVKIKATDMTGNTGETEEFFFVIDTVAPVLEVIYTGYGQDGTQTVLTPSDGRICAGEDISGIVATAMVIEENFDEKGGSVSFRAENSRGEPVAVLDFDEAIRGEWERKGTAVYELDLPLIATDARYEFVYEYTDLAGNHLKDAVRHTVVLDREKPEGTIRVENLINGEFTTLWKKLVRIFTFGYFGKDVAEVSMSSEDETSGIASMEYLLSSVPLQEETLGDEEGWIEYSGRIHLPANRRVIVYGKVRDMAGNIQYISTDGVVIDNMAPVPAVKVVPAKAGWGKETYNASDAPECEVSVEDPDTGEVCAGLKRISYEMINGTTGYAEKGVLAELDRTLHRKNWKGHIPIDPEKFSSNDVRLQVYAEDWSSNTGVSEDTRIRIDCEAPEVTFSFDRSDVHHGKYYNTDKTLMITVKERNFDESYLPEITSTKGEGYRIGEWRHKGELHTIAVEFYGDGEYTASYQCYDLAGNQSNREETEEFFIDKTEPVIRVSYDDHQAKNGVYYKDGRTAEITVTDAHFSPELIEVTVERETQGQVISVPEKEEWRKNGENYTAEVSFLEDGDYTLAVSGSDLAGNEAKPYGIDHFTVDRTCPEVAITNIEDHSANNGEVAPVIILKDHNFDSGTTIVSLEGVKKGKIDTTGMCRMEVSREGQIFAFSDFKESMDDIYTLMAETTDQAGNTSRASKIFSVNRDGSTFCYDAYTETLIRNGYTGKPQNLVIMEVNVDDLLQQEITVSENGVLKTLEPGKDYQVERTGEEGAWKEYRYTVYAKNFEAEGEYVVTVYSEDRADNAATNRSGDTELLFYVDRTSPVIALSDIEDGGKYKTDELQFTAHVDDNVALDRVEYYIDGEQKRMFEAEEIAAEHGSLRLTAGKSDRFQDITVKAHDKAGNKETAVHVRILVSASAWVQFYHNIRMLCGMAAGVLLGVAMLVWLVRKIHINQKVGNDL